MVERREAWKMCATFECAHCSESCSFFSSSVWSYRSETARPHDPARHFYLSRFLTCEYSMFSALAACLVLLVDGVSQGPDSSS
jgi:hypothetical protein